MPIHDYFIPGEKLDELWERHRQVEDGGDMCLRCDERWPCAIARWLCDQQERYVNG